MDFSFIGVVLCCSDCEFLFVREFLFVWLTTFPPKDSVYYGQEAELQKFLVDPQPVSSGKT